MPSNPVTRVVATDLLLGDREPWEIEAGNYVIVPTEPLYVYRTDRCPNGTVIVTLKRREAESHG